MNKTSSFIIQHSSFARAAALTLVALLAACATPPSAPQPTVVETFEHAGFTWKRWSDGTVTSNDGHLGRTDPRIPLCDARTITADPKRLASGKPYAAECRVR